METQRGFAKRKKFGGPVLGGLDLLLPSLVICEQESRGLQQILPRGQRTDAGKGYALDGAIASDAGNTAQQRGGCAETLRRRTGIIRAYRSICK
jgi:hypothetical protein